MLAAASLSRSNFFGASFAITSLRLKAAGFCRIGC